MSGNLYIYGKVGADVMPDTTGFRRELQAKLAAAMRGYEYEVPISVDIDAMSYRAFKKKIENDELEQTIKLAYDASQVKKAMRDLGGKDLDELKIPLDADTRQFERETRRTANQLEDNIEEALSRGFKLGTGNAQRALNDLKRRIEADKFEMTIDAQVDLDEAQRQLDRLGRDLKIADRFDRQADQLERRAKLMAARFPDFEIDVDIDKAVADLRRLSQQVKDGEDLSVTVRGKAELNLREANRELDRFKDKHDKLDMDVDVSTALASAHLAYFTRPRTVDIYANFKGTDLGKIINGITYGATGLEGVTNQFQKLVKLFDSLDDVVPKFSLIGAAAISLGAGLLNLGRSAGGVGVSLVSMSKAALAAPAALAGLASAGYGVYAAYQVVGKQFDVTQTKLNGLTTTVGTAAWNEFGDELYRIANEIAPTLTDGLSGIATEEGKVAAGLLQVVEQSDKAGELANIFSRTQQMVAELNPGLQDLVKSFLDLGDETSEYLPRMGAYISDAAESMSHWVEQARQSGAISDAMESAIEQGGYLKDSFKSLTGILGGTFGTLAQTENGIEGISEALAKADRAVNSVKFQETLESWSRGAQTAQDNMRDSLGDIGDAMYSLRDEAEQVFGDAGAIVGSGIEGISRVLEQSGDGIKDFSSGIRDGFEDVFDAVGDAGPMFDELLSMVGDLSRTFGGTFASSLRASAPLIETVASGAEAVAEAFDALPDPIKGAIGLYTTFGRAGKSALDSLKVGMLTNIEQTLKYQRTLREAGLAVDTARVSFLQLGQAMLNIHSSNAVTAFSGMDKSLTGVGKSASAASKGIGGLSGVLGSVKTAGMNLGGTLLAAFGGPAGVGLTAAIGAVTFALSDYEDRAAHTQQVTDGIGESMAGLKENAREASDAVADAFSQIDKNWSDDKYQASGWDWLTEVTTGLKNAEDAAGRLGLTTDDLTDAVTGNNGSYQALIDSLKETSKETYLTSDAYGVMQYRATPAADAASYLLGVLEKQRTEGWEKAEKSIRKYIDSVDNISDLSGQLSDDISDLTESFEANGNTLDESTAGGQRNAKMLQDLATDAKLTAKSMLEYGQANGQVDEYTQQAVNTIYEARQAIIEAGMAAGMSQEDAEAYADSLGLIPSDVGTTITADTKLAREEVESYIERLALTEGQKQIVLTAYDQGVYQDIGELMDYLGGVLKGEYTIVVTGDNKQVVMSVEQAEHVAKAMADGTYKTTLDAEDLASPKIDALIKKLDDSGVKDKDIKLLLDADDKASEKIDNVSKIAKALGLTQEELTLIANTDNADAALDGIRQKLRDLGLNDTQIDVLLDAIDKATPSYDNVVGELKENARNNPISMTLDADDSKARVTFAALQSEPDIQKQMIVSGEPSNAQYVYGYMQSMADIIKWMYMYGNNDDAVAKAGGAKSAVEGIPTYWQSMLNALGNTSPFAQDADRSVRSVPTQWQSMLNAAGSTRGEASNAERAIKNVPTRWESSINARVSGYSAVANLAYAIGNVVSKTVDIVANVISPSRHAVGGRISGPGTGTSDSIPAMLSNGEYVLRASSVRKLDAKYGSGWIDYLNRMGEIPNRRVSSTVERYRRDSYAYASGGRVRAVDIGSSSVDNSRVVNVTIDARRVQSDPTLRRLLGSLADHVTRYSNM